MIQRVTSVYNMRQAVFSSDPLVTGHGEEGIKTECVSKTCRPKEFAKTQAPGEFQNQIQPMWRALGQGKRLLRLQEKPEQTGKGGPAERHWGASSFPPLAKSLHSLGNCSGRQSPASPNSESSRASRSWATMQSPLASYITSA